MGASWKRQRNVWKRQRNIASLRRHAIAWLSWPRQNTNARPWKKWLRLGEWWLRRRITKASSQPIVSRQPRLRALLPNETTLVPCAAAKPALAHLRRGALAISTHERSADTHPTLSRRNASPIPQREIAIGVPFFWRTGGLLARPRCDGKLKASLPQKKTPSSMRARGPKVVCLKFRLKTGQRRIFQS